MSSSSSDSAGADANWARRVSSTERLLMYGIEKWPSSLSDHWQRKMEEARNDAVRHGLDSQLVLEAACLGIARLVRIADAFQTEMYERVRAFVNEHEIAISEVVDEMHYRISTVGMGFGLTEEQLEQAVLGGLSRYVEAGGSPEFAINLANAMRIVEERRSFLWLRAGS